MLVHLYARRPRDLPVRSALLRLLQSRNGAVSAEYLLVVALLGISLAVTLVGIAPDVVRSWSWSRHVLYGASP